MDKKKEYLRYTIETGNGLQKVDGLETSKYFKDVTDKYISSEISFDEAYELINSYYESKPASEKGSEEADKAAINIASLLSEPGFTFTVGQYLAIHKRLFSNVFPHAGKMRTFNFTKKEWVLDGDTVIYGDYRELEDTLNYDFKVEREYSYKGKSMNEIIDHLATFVSNLWQIHVFEEGNTRTTAVFFIKYLRTLGLDVTNDTFAKNAWYFRNALVRANYNNISKGVYADKSYLIMFLRNLLLNEKNPLENKYLTIKKEDFIIQDNAHLSSLERQVLDLMEKNPKISADQLSLATSKSIRTIKMVFASLKEKGLIERRNGKRDGYWEVKER